MADFSIAEAHTARVEGGYVNNPKDRGGETYNGIARKFHPGWTGWPIIDGWKAAKGISFKPFIGSGQASQILAPHVTQFYRKEFWDSLRLSEIKSQAIADELYDTAVNMGVVIAGRFLQRALNGLNREGNTFPDLAVDGHVGPATINAANILPEQGNLLKLLNCLQGARYLEICEGNRSQEDFLHGWLSNRVKI